MKHIGKKYIIKESELKEIIKEMIIVEAYNHSDFSANFLDGKTPGKSIAPKDYISKIGQLIGGIPGAVIPDEYKERIESGDNSVLQWLLGALAGNTAGRTGPDYVPDLRSLKWLGGSGWGNGNNYDAKETFNPRAAAKWLKSHATSHYIKGQNGHCGTNVRAALNYGGLSAPWGMFSASRYASGYASILPSNGWVEIPESQAGQIGDIVVLDAFVTNDRKRQKHPYGHIAMCCGNGLWVSDFVQSNMYGINGSVPKNSVHIFRYKNIV